MGINRSLFDCGEDEVKYYTVPFLYWLNKRRWFIIFVVIPTIISALYYGLIASDIYLSESRFVVKSADQKKSQISTLANLVQTTGLSAGQEQTNEVLTYIRSRDALAALQKSANVRARYSRNDVDVFARFPPPFSIPSFESLFKYYGKMVDARLDSDTGTASIRTEAFTAEDAYVIDSHLLDLSEAMVNRLNDRAQMKAIAEAQAQVDRATARAKASRVALAQYRNTRGLIDPGKQAGGVLEISNGLISRRATLQAQLSLMQQMTPANPSIRALHNQIEAVSAQIAQQDKRVVGSDSGIASNLGGYENLLVEQEFATESMNTASAALVQARSDAQRQQFYLERIVDPNLPDRPLLPKRLLNILVVAAVATCLYFIGWMLMMGVIEHTPEA